jgi:hypothetical protein
LSNRIVWRLLADAAGIAGAPYHAEFVLAVFKFGSEAA